MMLESGNSRGNHAGKIKNVVINALLESLYDILDRDGQLSILMRAGLPELATKRLNPTEYSPIEVFNKIIGAMNELLCFSTIILNEIGRKFAIYSDPQGSGLEQMIDKLRQWFKTDWKIELVEKDANKAIIRVENCPFSAGVTEGSVSEAGAVFRAILSRVAAKSSPNPENVLVLEKNNLLTIHLK